MAKESKSGLVIQTFVVFTILAVFTAFAFFVPQECDIDKIYLWCRLHPLTTVDLFGLVFFYGGGLMLAGIPKWLGFELGSPEGSNAINLWTFAAMVLGAILMWA